MRIKAIPALADNYIWVWSQGDQAIIVDPGEAKPVLEYLEKNQLKAGAILITHVHSDHVDGIGEIVEKYPNVRTYGPAEVSHLVHTVLADGEQIDLYGFQIEVFLTAGHSEQHISYLVDKEHLLCGDSLFSAGCGRVFTGDYDAQYQSMVFFRSLADEVKVYCGHEYTLTNLRFGMTLNSTSFIKHYYEQMKAIGEQGSPTLPSTIGVEKKINVFLMAEDVETLTRLRTLRDHF
ncbi:hydroxyacylglutathione hydrolase [Streptococcus moroccensis]|uniref:Hydroxyacylglutathione hydrolase n=1 Tax=Streptococcus moroccensis TaxID=1451356 RepID=A0ABT9YQD1_9STRE|nr:hydroxyacylglutathione hydrolase [Streptococcus moroccensis]MDQ0221797.1 hydroxyacylglutathione hydrolase [Streptococcus moroccensis]